MRLVLTSGFDRAAHVLALAELASRRGHEVAGILVVTPFNFARARKLLVQRGLSALQQAARRMAGTDRSTSGAELERFLVASQIPERSISRWCRRRDVPRETVRDLNGPEAIAFVNRLRCDALVYGGGGILRRGIIEAAHQRVLNAHSGPLPRIRGMNACEWAIVLGLEPTVSIHLIDEGIDTGATLRERRIRIERGDSIDRLRSRCVIEGVLGLLEVIDDGCRLPPPPQQLQPAARQCFTMAPAMAELAAARLSAQTR